MAKLQVKVVTPARVLYDGEVDFVVLRTLEGEKGILPNHETCAVLLDYGLLKLYQGKEIVESLAVLGGVAVVEKNQINVLSNSAERPEDIDRLRAERAKLRAQARKQQQDSDMSMHRAQLMLRRALVSKEFHGASSFLEEDQEQTSENNNSD